LIQQDLIVAPKREIRNKREEGNKMSFAMKTKKNARLFIATAPL